MSTYGGCAIGGNALSVTMPCMRKMTSSIDTSSAAGIIIRQQVGWLNALGSNSSIYTDYVQYNGFIQHVNPTSHLVSCLAPVSNPLATCPSARLI